VLTRAQQERFTPNLALELARVTPLGAWPLIDYLVVTADTVEAGVRQLARYVRIIGAPFSIEIRDDAETIRVEMTTLASPFAIEFDAALMVQVFGAPMAMLGGRIGGKRLGIVGMGRIGQAVAKRARAFGLQVHYHNRRRVSPEVEKALEATYWDSLDQMLARMDIISINCPHTPATYHLLSARRLALMKPSAYIVNTARGEVIDENALARMIENDELGGAGLDVFEHEPAVNPKLLKSDKVVVLPHMGSATLEGRIDMGEKVIINIKTFLDGHAPPDRVHPAMF
jgi:lactate dehydrogenase-like 2-hydroxyacid dehydrogenase